MPKWALLLCCLPLLAVAGEKGSLIKADDLKAEPFRDGKTLSRLSKDVVVDILKKQGGWLQVKSGGQSGWLRTLSVRSGVAKAASAGGLLALASGRQSGGKIVATTGIRGLNDDSNGVGLSSEAALQRARFNAEGWTKFEKLAVDAPTASTFARTGKLTARSIDWLAEGQ